MDNPCVLDPTNDRAGTERHAIYQLVEPPEYVKTASETDLIGFDAAPNHVFADQARRRFACHTPAATWLSAAFLYKHAGELSTTAARRYEARLHEAARFFNNIQDIEKVAKALQDQEDFSLARLPDDAFALVYSYAAEGTTSRHYPLRNAMEVEKAAAWLLQFRDEFEYNDRRTVATKILTKAAEYNVDVPQQLESIAGVGLSASDDILLGLQNRASAARPQFPKMAAALDAAIADIRSDVTELQQPSVRVKLAEIIDTFDTQTRLSRRYDKDIVRPEDLLFGTPINTPADFVNEHIGLPTGTVYKAAALVQLPLEQYRNWLGHEFAEDVSFAGIFVDEPKLRQKLASVTAQQATAFDKMMQASNIAAEYVDQPQVTRFSAEDLEKLAKMHNTSPLAVLT